MSGTDPDLLAVACRHLGPVTPLPRLDLPPHLQVLTAADGQRYILKHHQTPDRFHAEVHAYSTWVPVLKEHAPSLIHTDPETLSLLLTAIPGQRATQLPEDSDAERLTHRHAGHVLRLLHQAPPGQHTTIDVPAYLAERMRWWAARAHLAALITSSDLQILYSWADEMAAETLETTVCHLDYQPRNWIVGDVGQVGVVDFEHTRLDARIRDFARLEHRYWRRAPHLCAAFFDGYGRPLNFAEQQLLERFRLLEAVTALVRGHEANNAELLTHGRTLIASIHQPPQRTPMPTPAAAHGPRESLPRRAVVTGAAGFIGSHLCQALLARGVTVIGVDRRDPSKHLSAAHNLADIRTHPGFVFATGDLRTCAIEPLLLDADVVFHLAGVPGVQPSWGADFDDYVASNISATQRLMHAVTRLRIPRLVVASSSSVYGAPDGDRPSVETDHPRPASPYAVTKLAEEQLCLAHAARSDCDTTVVALRYFTIYGPRQREDMFVQRLLTAASTGLTLQIYGDGKQRRDFTYIHDAINATIAAGTVYLPNSVINVGAGRTISLNDVVERAHQLTGQPINVRSTSARSGDVSVTCADVTSARRLLGWAPTTDLVTGMATQLDWMASSRSPSPVAAEAV
ncbi:NAD-dependent epimerase/dehydratase family protein [Nonomuraea harbinensis]|uniref:NAD-dependent epimerase/dehydratase family protein n=1 Tax=Nonomuraea harbinensis TaxID=1286938 RepID=A0ABW1C8U2_9ACTN|nr:NAD-dependent epimerase/dehydratase family protein [Nonomuraea harbinensis]